MTNPDVQQAVQAGEAAQLQAADLSATRTLDELRRIAFADLAGCFDAAGNLLPLADMSPEARAAVASVKVVKRSADDDDRLDEVHEVKFWDKVRALEQLAKHFGLLVERIEHTGSVDLVHRLQAARQRGKPAPAVLVEATPVEE
jgi:phage terminase small subunit